MRNILLNLTVSLDGFIEGPNGEFDWCFTDQDYGMTAFLEQTDTILLGRKSYELLLTMEGDSFPNHKKYVFSQTLDAVAAPYILQKGPAEDAVRRLRAEPGKDMWLFGGAALLSSLLNAGLVDQFMISVHPILLGGGKPLFQGLGGRIPLHFERSESFSSGLVQLFYRVPFPTFAPCESKS